MAVTLPPIAPNIPHYCTYNHTGGVCMPHKDPAPPIVRGPACEVNILWHSEEPREQPRVSCPSVHMCEPNESLLPVQMTGSMCAVMGPSAQSGFELKNTHLVWLRRLRWPCSLRRVLETCCTWRKQSSRRGSRMAATRKKITRELREALGAASSRAATRSRCFHPASLCCHRGFRSRFTGGRGKMWPQGLRRVGSNVRKPLAGPQPSPDPPRPTLTPGPRAGSGGAHIR